MRSQNFRIDDDDDMASSSQVFYPGDGEVVDLQGGQVFSMDAVRQMEDHHNAIMDSISSSHHRNTSAMAGLRSFSESAKSLGASARSLISPVQSPRLLDGRKMLSSSSRLIPRLNSDSDDDNQSGADEEDHRNSVGGMTTRPLPTLNLGTDQLFRRKKNDALENSFYFDLSYLNE